MRLKPSGLRYLDIAKFQCGLRFYSVRCLYTGISVRFCYVILYGVWCLYTGISERFRGVRTLLTPPPPLLDFCLI